MKDQKKEADQFQDLPIEQRAQALEDNAYRMEETTINRPYSEEQLVEFKDELASEMINLNELEVELKVIKDDFKAKMKPYLLKKAELLKNLKLKHEESFETVYLMDDQQDGTMTVYDSQGKFILSRILYPNERQTKLIPIRDTGTNDN